MKIYAVICTTPDIPEVQKNSIWFSEESARDRVRELAGISGWISMIVLDTEDEPPRPSIAASAPPPALAKEYRP